MVRRHRSPSGTSAHPPTRRVVVSGVAVAAVMLGGAVTVAVHASAPSFSAAPASHSGLPRESVIGPAVHTGTVFAPLPRFCQPSTPTSSRTASGSPGSGAGAAAPPPSRSFDGLSGDDSQIKFPSADTSGSAGRYAYGETINTAIGFFNKATGQPLCPAQPTSQMWAGTPCATGTFGDAVLRYDTLASRWVVAKPGAGGSCVAVSQSDDPTAGWYRYQFPLNVPGEPGDGDFAKLSIWQDSYTFSARDLVRTGPGGTVHGDYVAAFQRDAMLNGRLASAAEFLVPQTPTPDGQPAGDDFYFLPASAEGSATAPRPGAAAPFVQRFRGTSGRLDVWELNVDWRHPAGATFSRTADVPVQPYTDDVPAITQPPIAGTHSPTLTAAEAPILAQPLIWRSANGHDTVYGALTTAVTTVSGTHAGIRWFELQHIHNRWSIAQQGTYAPADGNSRWLASLSVDRRGNIGLMFNVSGPHLYPSLHYTGRLASDAPGTMRPEQTLINGNGSQGTQTAFGDCQQECSFGDYSQASLDPTDGCTIWMAGEYYSDQTRASAGNPTTRIGAFRFPECGGKPRA